MTKRILAAALAFCLVIALIPAAHAQDDLTPTPVMAWQQGYRSLNTYRDGDDLLMCADDLSWLTGFTYSESGDVFRFTRGSKTVVVNAKSQQIYMAGSTYGLNLVSGCRNIDGKWYLSAASVLPWLNTHCSISDGALVAVPNAVSLWDIIDTFDPTEYSFTMEEALTSVSMVGRECSASMVVTNGLGSIYYLAGDSQNSNMGEELEFYELFSDMIQDVSVTDKAIFTWLERYDNVEKAIGFVGTGIGFLDETMDVDTAPMSYSKEALSLLAYCAMFRQDGANKVTLLQTLVDGTDASSNSGMVSAALDVIDNYTDFWEGLFNKIRHQMVSNLPDEATSGTVLGMLGYAQKVAHPSSKQVRRITRYNTLIAEALDGYRCYTGETTLKHLKNYVNYIILYLYATEQNYRAMAAYLEDNSLLTPAEARTYLQKAEKAETAQAEFVNISLLLEDDCSDLGLKREGSQAYLELFRQIDSMLVPQGITAAAENAIYWAALEDMNVPVYYWDVADVDLDGEQELFVHCDDAMEQWPTFLTVDPNNYSMGSYEGTSFFEYLYLRKLGDGRYGIHKDDDQGVQSDSVMVWDGQTYKPIPAQGLQETDLPSPDLTEQTITGNTADLMNRLDHYFGWHRDCHTFRYDLNGDGNKDRVFVLINAADLWTKLSGIAGTGSCNALYYDDDKATFLVAETQPDGIKLRICRMSVPGSADDLQLDAENGTLTVGGRIYSYQTTGKPFVSQKNTYGITAADLLGLTEDEIRPLLDEFNENDGPQEGTAYGYYQGAYLYMVFTEYYGAPSGESVLAELSINAWDGERVPIVDQLCTGDTVLDLIDKTPSLADMTDFYPVGAYYEVGSSYRDKAGNNYMFTAAFNGDTLDATLAYAIFTLQR